MDVAAEDFLRRNGQLDRRVRRREHRARAVLHGGHHHFGPDIRRRQQEGVNAQVLAADSAERLERFAHVALFAAERHEHKIRTAQRHQAGEAEYIRDHRDLEALRDELVAQPLRDLRIGMGQIDQPISVEIRPVRYRVRKSIHFATWGCRPKLLPVHADTSR